MRARGCHRDARPRMPPGCATLSRIRALLADDHPQFAELAETLPVRRLGLWEGG